MDGKTTGRVRVEIRDFPDEFGKTSPLAKVTFSDLVTPWDHLTAGGSLADRSGDPCFDTGMRAGGGSITPDKNGSATTTMPAAGERPGENLHEIVLHLDWTQIDADAEECMQPVVARAAIVWGSQ